MLGHLFNRQYRPTYHPTVTALQGCLKYPHHRILGFRAALTAVHDVLLCMIKIFRGGEGVVDGVGGSSKRCLKWGGGGSLRDLSKDILKQGVGKGKSCS